MTCWIIRPTTIEFVRSYVPRPRVSVKHTSSTVKHQTEPFSPVQFSTARVSNTITAEQENFEQHQTPAAKMAHTQAETSTTAQRDCPWCTVRVTGNAVKERAALGYSLSLYEILMFFCASHGLVHSISHFLMHDKYKLKEGNNSSHISLGTRDARRLTS